MSFLRRLFVAVLLAGALACASGGASGPSAPGPDGAELAAVVEAVQQALSQSETRDVAGFPPLKSATVRLQTEASRGLDGGIALYVFAIDSHYSAETASTVELKLKPAAGERGIRAAGELEQALARAIDLAKRASARAGEGTPSFLVSDVEINLKFTVERGGSAGAKVKLVPLGAEAGGKIGRNQVQSLTLVFGR